MYRLLIVALLAVTVSATNVFAAGAFPWFHTKPKSVVLDDPPPTPTRVAYHGAAVYPKTGRVYFEDRYDRVKHEQSSKFHLSDVFPISRLTGSQPAKPNPPRTK
jgi:hypothetical protein